MVARHLVAPAPCMLMSSVTPSGTRAWRLCSASILAVKIFSVLRGQGLGPADQLRDLLRDHRLARAVRVQDVPLAHLLRVLGRGVHRVHARRELGGLRLEEDAVKL